MLKTNKSSGSRKIYLIQRKYTNLHNLGTFDESNNARKAIIKKFKNIFFIQPRDLIQKPIPFLCIQYFFNQISTQKSAYAKKEN